MRNVWATFNKYDVEVRFVPANHSKLSGAHGMTYFSDGEIYISQSLTKRMTLRTLIHEFTHFALWAYDVSADDAEQNIGLLTEEQLCYLAERFIPEIYEQAYSVLEMVKG